MVFCLVIELEFNPGKRDLVSFASNPWPAASDNSAAPQHELIIHLHHGHTDSHAYPCILAFIPLLVDLFLFSRLIYLLFCGFSVFSWFPLVASTLVIHINIVDCFNHLIDCRFSILTFIIFNHLWLFVYFRRPLADYVKEHERSFCLQYEAYTSNTDENRVLVIERYTNQEEFVSKHRTSEPFFHYKAGVGSDWIKRVDGHDYTESGMGFA